MIANRKLSIATAAGCFLLLILWLFFWLFIASLDSGRMTDTSLIDGKEHTVDRYDNAQRYGPYIPDVVLGIYGGVIGSIASILVRRKPQAQRLLSALVFSPMIAVISTVVICGVLAFLTPSNFYPPDLNPAQRILPTLGLVLFYSAGVCIFGGFPAALSGFATACLFSGEHTPPVVSISPPPLPKAGGL